MLRERVIQTCKKMLDKTELNAAIQEAVEDSLVESKNSEMKCNAKLCLPL